MKEVVLGLLGLGNIGGGVWDLIREFGGETAKRTGVQLRVKKALVLDKRIHGGKEVPDEVLTTDRNDILEDPEIQIVCEFLGGTICPGIKLSSEALVTGTAKLPRFELTRPDTVIGRTTLSNLQSGMYYGYVGLVRNIVRKIRQELGEEAYVVATGGMALMIAEESKVIDKLDGLLTLKGLRLIYERNRTEG